MASVKRDTLVGHTDAVICLSASLHGNLIASGAEDGRLCLHDLPAGVLAHSLTLDKHNAVAAVAYHPSQPNLLLAATGLQVHVLDTRQLDSGTLASCCANGEEVSCLAVHRNGKDVAAGDDAGEVQLLEVAPDGQLRPRRPLRPAHDSICSGLLFRRHRPHELLTAGLDCRLKRWEYGRGRCLDSWAMQAADEAAQEGAAAGGRGGAAPAAATATSQMCNPPFVHALAAPGGDHPALRRLVAAGLGDGTVAIFDTESTTAGGKPRAADSSSGSRGAGAWPEALAAAPGCSLRLGADGCGHSKSAAALAWLPTAEAGRFLASGGEDRRLVVWDWSAALAGQQQQQQQQQQVQQQGQDPQQRGEVGQDGATGVGARPPSGAAGASARDVEAAAGGVAAGHATGEAGAPASGARASIGRAAASEGQALPPWVRLRLQHGRKVNALCGVAGPGAAAGARLVVADTGRRLSVYHLM